MLTLILVFLISISVGAQAMSIEVHGDSVYASGPVENDLAQFQVALANPKIKRLVLVNSPGGDLVTGMRVGQLVSERGINTVVAGYCNSSCSIMFMGGKERSFSDAFRPGRTFVGIHGAHHKVTKAVIPHMNAPIFEYFQQNMAERFNAAVMNKALYDMQDAGAMLKVFDAARQPVRVTYHCQSTRTLRKDCTNFEGFTALNLGVVTTNALTPLDLPNSFKETPKVLGQTLSFPLADRENYFENLIEAKCASDVCAERVQNFLRTKEHKALAMPTDSTVGLGIVYDRETPIHAFVAAIYACNHAKDRPARLCETLVVNGFDARDVYLTGMAHHARMLTKLNPPTESHYGAEEEEAAGTMPSARVMRPPFAQDTTPQKFAGIKTYGTQALATALKSVQAPVLVDVWAGVNDAIPSAVTLLSGGMAFDDLGAEQAFEARFLGLLKLLSPDPHKPIVFYCRGSDSGLSANAAMRAKKLGYTQVGWYRGGMESWKSANLPVAAVVLRAVAY